MKYLIKYWDKYQNIKTYWIRAKNRQKAEQKFYKKTFGNLILNIYPEKDLK